MRLGALVFATDTGLGRQSELLYRLLKPSKVMLVDISSLNGMPIHEDWFNFDIRTRGYPTNVEVDRFLRGLDVVFMCETPLNYYLLSRARQLGIRTITQVNPEFLDFFIRPHLPRPDVIALPSSWMEDEIRSVAQTSVVSLSVPIDTASLPKRTITEAKTFFHIAGRPAHGDRNGTLDFISAARMAQQHEPDAQYLLYCQQPTPEIERALLGSRVELVRHLEDYADLYRNGDILVLPRKYGGLCLPQQEAIGSGIPVLMPDISPNNAWLPSEWLLPVLPTHNIFKPRGAAIPVFTTDATRLAQRMLDLYRAPGDVQAMAKQARELADTLTWDALKPLYEEVLQPHEASVA